MVTVAEFFSGLIGDNEIVIVDVGAALMEDDPYFKLTDHPNVRIISFEPNPKAFRVRSKVKSDRETIFPYFIGDGSSHSLYSTNHYVSSSLLEPNVDVRKLFTDMDTHITEVTTVDTKRLDDLGIDKVDLLKIDTQGAELMILQNGRKLVSSSTLLDIEVSFIPMYINQPLFAEIDLEVRGQGFMFHRFEGLFSRQFSPCIFNNDPFHEGSQHLYAYSAYFVRNLLQLDNIPDDKLINMAFLAAEAWDAKDLVVHLLHVLQTRRGGDIVNQYLSAVS